MGEKKNTPAIDQKKKGKESGVIFCHSKRLFKKRNSVILLVGAKTSGPLKSCFWSD